MKLSLRLLSQWVLGLSGALGLPTAYAIPVNVVSDPTREIHYAAEMAKWGEQMSQWAIQIEQMKLLVQQANEVAEIVGNPKSIIDSMSSLGGAAEQLDYIFKNETTSAIRKGIKGADSLDRASTGLNKTVESSVMIGGKRQSRNASLYGAYSLLERMHSNYENIVSQDKKVQEREAKRQKALIDALIKAQTEWERERIRAAIEASKGVQVASSDAVFKAKEAYDAEIMAIEIENKKQALAQMEAAEMKRQHTNKLIDESNKQWQSHLEKDYFAETTVDNKIELLIQKTPKP